MLAPMLMLQPIQVNTGSRDSEGRLVLANNCLVAVLVRLDGEEHGTLRGRWSLEAGFGPCSDLPPRPFRSLADAQRWVQRQLAST